MPASIASLKKGYFEHIRPGQALNSVSEVVAHQQTSNKSAVSRGWQLGLSSGWVNFRSQQSLSSGHAANVM
jgi:hypothetical protein